MSTDGCPICGRAQWAEQTIARQREQLVDWQEKMDAARSTIVMQDVAIDNLLRFLLKAGFVLPQHAVERDRLIEKIEGQMSKPRRFLGETGGGEQTCS